MGYSRRYKSEHEFIYRAARDMMARFDLFQSMTAELCYESLQMARCLLCI